MKKIFLFVMMSVGLLYADGGRKSNLHWSFSEENDAYNRDMERRRARDEKIRKQNAEDSSWVVLLGALTHQSSISNLPDDSPVTS